MASKPTQRTMAQLKKDGFMAGIVEKFNQFARIRQDFGGFADIIAYHPEKDFTLAIQTTSGSNVANRVTKLEALDSVRKWLSQPSRRLEVWGWGKCGARGKRKVWTLRVVDMADKFVGNSKEI